MSRAKNLFREEASPEKLSEERQALRFAKETREVRVKEVFQNLLLEKQMIGFRNSKKTTQRSVLDLTEKAVTIQAKKDFQKGQQVVDSVAMKISQVKEAFQNQDSEKGTTQIDLKGQPGAGLIVMKINRAKEVFRSRVLKGVVAQIDSRKRDMKSQLEADSVVMKTNQAKEVSLSLDSERVVASRNPLKRKNLRETKNPNLKKESGRKILVSRINQEKEKNLLMAQSKSTREKILIPE